jgi:DNA replication protein DnaC
MQTVVEGISELRSSQNQTDHFQGSEEERAKLAEEARVALGLPVGTPIDEIRRQYNQAARRKIDEAERKERAIHASERAARIKQQETDEGERNKRERIAGYWRDSNCPERHKQNAETFTGPPVWLAKKTAAWEIVSNGGIVALIGSRGNGKTQMAVDLIRHTCNQDARARYLKAMDFFMELRATFQRERAHDEGDVIQWYLDCRLLVLDNTDRRGSSDWEDRLLTHLIDKRYDRAVPTILIANLDPGEFAAQMGPDIVDRIRDGGGLIVADWPSFRGAA